MPALPVGFALLAAGGAAAGASVYSANQQAKASKNAANDAAVANAAAIQSVKDAQNNASTQAANAIQAKQRARAGSQSIFTSPLGIPTQAETAKKTLLGQ